MRVLLVEDLLAVGKTMAAELSAFGYQILGPVTTGEEAVALCRRETPDIALMDIELSGEMDGIAAAKKLLQGQQIPVIYLTGHVDLDTLNGAIESGSSTYLLKPVRAVELHANIQMTIHLAQAQARLTESENKYRYLLNNIYDGYSYHRAVRDDSGKIINFTVTETNEAFLRLFQTKREGCVGHCLTELIPDMFIDSQDVLFSLANVVKYKNSFQLDEFYVSSVDSWFSFQAASPQPESLAIVFTDITEKKKAEENIRFLGFHDPLTKLYNRAFFEAELERLDQERQLPLSVIFADMNNLKYVNDTLGHLVGDECLRIVGDILKDACRREDIICRWGGDEFVILLPSTTNDVGSKICQRIRRRAWGMEPPAGASQFPAIALGCATKGIIEQNIKDVFKEAEARMYLDKAAAAAANRGVENGQQ